jgi:subtilisin
MSLRLLSVAMVSSLLVLFASTHVNAGQRIVPDRLYQQAWSSGSARVIVRFHTAFSPDVDLRSEAHALTRRQDIASARSALKSHLKGHHHAIVREYDALPFLAIEAGSDALSALEALPGVVAQVTEDRIDHIQMAQSGPIVQAPQAWAAGFDGTGTIVAVLDTGVLRTHSFLTGKVIAEACFSSNTTNAGFTITSLCPGGVTTSTAVGSGVNCPATVAGCDHGTHVAGIVAGGITGASGAGVAPGAKIMAIQVFSKFPAGHPECDGSACVLSFTSDQIAALNYVYNQRNAFSGKTIAAINLSLGGGDFDEPCSGDPRVGPIAQLKAAGIATVVASGNSGYTDAMNAPACVPGAVSVGSTGDGSSGATLDRVSSYSNSASFLSLLAPGQWINSSVAPSGFANFAGTSMATPHVAGAFAVLRAANRGASIDTLLAALQNSGVPVTDSRPPCPGCATSEATKKRIRLKAALDLVAAPDVAVTGASTAAAAAPETAIAVDNTVTNGSVAMGAFTVGFYLSTDSIFDAGDVRLGSRAVASLAAGGVSHAINTLTIPAGTAPGVYRILVRAETARSLAESSESNNVRATAPITIGRDVSVTAAATATAAGPGETIVVDHTVKNTGSVAITTAFTVAFYLSTDATINAGDVLLGTRTVSSLAAGAVSRNLKSVVIPKGTAMGTYRILVRADSGALLAEATESNNIRATAAVVIGGDLTVTAATTVASAVPGQTISIAYTVKTGLMTVGGFTVAFYLSTDGVFNAGDAALGTRSIASMAAAAATSNTESVTIPTGTAPGTYRILVRADSTGAVVEASESNNVRATGTITIAPRCTAPIAIGAVVSGTLTATDCLSVIDGAGFYADVYSFSGVAGQQISVLARSTQIDTYLRLLDGSGAVIAFNDDGAGGTDSRLPPTGVFTLPAGGTYRVEITAFTVNDTGGYTLVVSETSTSPARASRTAVHSPAGAGDPGVKVKPRGGVGD